MATNSQQDASPILSVDGLIKDFPGVRALDGVKFELRPGEIHALVGENGAGKSTLIKMLSGDIRPDSGTISFRGRRVELTCPADARALGIATIFQEPTYVPGLSIAENVVLGNEPAIGPGRQVLLRRKAVLLARRQLLELGVDIDPCRRGHRLSVAQKQFIEIARALLLEASVIIMDEPTAALSDHEAETLLRAMQRLRAKGTSILFVSHRLNEVAKVADRITVLRGGRTVTTQSARSTDTRAVIELMVGKRLETLFPHLNEKIGDILFEARALTRADKFTDISFQVRSGEILGVAGLVGAGRTAVARAIFGADPVGSGTIFKGGRELRITKPSHAIAAGIAYIPEDRKEAGLVLPLSARENLSLVARGAYRRHALIRRPEIESRINGLARKLQIKGRLEQPVRNLSGGNQQKIVIGKWMLSSADLFIFDEPTRGIDIGAKTEVYRLMQGLASEGAAIIMISSDLPELMNVTHRMIVMSNGRIYDRLIAADYDEQRILSAAFAAHVGQSDFASRQGERAPSPVMAV